MKTLINIFGTARSGSTMLDLMLGNGDKAFSLGEVYAWYRPFRKHHFKLVCGCGKYPCPYWEKIQKVSDKKFHNETFDLLNVDFLIDSSKDLNWGIDNNLWARKNGIKVFNILLYKKPINFIYSIWKRGGDVEMAVHGYINYYKYFFQTNLPYVSLEFDQLVKESDSVLKQICEMTGQEYSSDKKYFWEKQHHQLFGSNGTKRQVKNRNSSIKTTEVFSEAYQKIIPKIELMLNSNKDFIYIQTQLTKNNLKNGYIIRNKRISKPYWYYLYKLRAFYKKRFPEEWNDIKE